MSVFKGGTSEHSIYFPLALKIDTKDNFVNSIRKIYTCLDQALCKNKNKNFKLQ